VDNVRLALTAMEKRHRKNFLKEVRKQRHLTQEQLGDLVGVKDSHITMMENGRRGISADMLVRLAVALQCHPAEITDGPATAIIARNDREREVLLIMREMGEREQETFSAGLKAFASAKKGNLTDGEKPLQKKDNRDHR